MLSEKSGAKIQLGPNSLEFSNLEYQLQISLKSSTVRILSAYSISNPHLTLSYERKSKDVLCLESWLDSTQLTGINTEEDVIRRGFQFAAPTQGLVFSVGQIDVEKTAGAAPYTRKAMLCLVGVGRAFVADLARAEREQVPQGYQSYYIQHEGVTEHTRDYRHDYFIKNSAQVLPQYLVTYEYDPNWEMAAREVM